MALSIRFDRICSTAARSAEARSSGATLLVERDALGLGLDLQRAEHAVDGAADVDHLDARLVAGLEARDVEQVGGQARQPLRVAHQDLEERRARLGIVGGAGGQRLGDADDRRHRRAQLVRGVGHELATQALEALGLGDVDEHHDRLARAGAAERIDRRRRARGRRAAPRATSARRRRAPLRSRRRRRARARRRGWRAPRPRPTRPHSRANAGLATAMTPSCTSATPSDMPLMMARSLWPSSRRSAMRAASWLRSVSSVLTRSPSSSSPGVGSATSKSPWLMARAARVIARIGRVSQLDSVVPSSSARVSAIRPASHTAKCARPTVAVTVSSESGDAQHAGTAAAPATAPAPRRRAGCRLTVAERRSATPTPPASASFTSGRDAWFSTPPRIAAGTSVSPRTRPSRSMTVTRSEVPVAGSSATQSARRSAAPAPARRRARAPRARASRARGRARCRRSTNRA